jgi:hypothetical protein
MPSSIRDVSALKFWVAIFTRWAAAFDRAETSIADRNAIRASTPTVVIAADFNSPADYPLSKTKFGVYSSGLVRLAHYERDIRLYDEARPNSLRIELRWGGGKWTKRPVSGRAGDLEFYFDEMDRIAALRARAGRDGTSPLSLPIYAANWPADPNSQRRGCI